jgi:hypothetical protein
MKMSRHASAGRVPDSSRRPSEFQGAADAVPAMAVIVTKTNVRKTLIIRVTPDHRSPVGDITTHEPQRQNATRPCCTTEIETAKLAEPVAASC